MSKLDAPTEPEPSDRNASVNTRSLAMVLTAIGTLLVGVGTVVTAFR